MDRMWIVLVGGLLPAFAFGVAAIVQKGAMLNGIGPGSYMVYNGIVFVAAGLLLRPVLGEPLVIASGWPLALAGGLCFAIATAAISFAVQRMGAPISLLAPITVISTLVTVVLGFLIFKEHESAMALKLLAGALLIVAGAALVATS